MLASQPSTKPAIAGGRLVARKLHGSCAPPPRLPHVPPRESLHPGRSGALTVLRVGSYPDHAALDPVAASAGKAGKAAQGAKAKAG